MAIQCGGKNSKNMHVQLKNIEWESTITIPIDELQYNNVQTNYPDYKLDVIFLFNNDSRLSNRRIERKVVTSCRNLLGFYKSEWFPIKRTTAIEELCTLDTSTQQPHTAIHRRIVHNHNGLRVSYNKEDCEDGIKYTLQYEIEYPENSAYQDILYCERHLMRKVLNDGYVIKRTAMSLENIFSCVMSKVQMWHCFDGAKKYIWAYKWNGVKSKLMITNNTATADAKMSYLWPDGNVVSTQLCTGNNLHLLENLCLLVEIMPKYIVIIEVIGALVGDIIYTTEPMMNAEILKYLHTNLTDVSIKGNRVLVQRFYPNPMPSFFDHELYDGFIIIQENEIIKWKQPTVDVKCEDGYSYSVAGTILTLEHYGTKDRIYEMTWQNKILRQRNDRITSSSENEYKIFLASSEHLKTTIDTAKECVQNLL